MHKITDLPEIEQQILNIRRLIITSMNGEVAESMINRGVNYKKNFGVSIPRLKEIATRFPKNSELAERLWDSRIREMMLLAIYLYPLEKFDEGKAKEWAKEIEQIELVEQYCMHLLVKLSYANEFVMKCIHSDDEMEEFMGFTLATRLWESFSDEQFRKIVSAGLKNAKTENFHLYKSIGNCLGRLCRRGKDDAHFINEKTSFLQESVSLSEQYIFQEVKNELVYSISKCDSL